MKPAITLPLMTTQEIGCTVKLFIFDGRAVKTKLFDSWEALNEWMLTHDR